MADITVQNLTKNDGVAVTYAAAANGDTVANFSSLHELIVKNASGGSINVTLSSHENCDQGADHDLVVAVANNAEKHFRLSPTSRFKNASTGKLDIAYSAITSVTVAVLKHPF